MQRSQLVKTTGVLLGLAIALPIPPFSLPVTARSVSSQARLKESRPRGDWGGPHTGAGTATDSRGGCPAVTHPLTALMPTSNWGTTLAERPTLWFYMPYTPDQISVGKFVLQDLEGTDIVEPLAFRLPNTPGFVSVTLPESVPVLELDQEYRWYFELYCNSPDTVPVEVNGWIQRQPLTPALEAQLSATPRPDQVYASERIWYDAIAHLLSQIRENPDSATLEANLAALLADGGIGLLPEVLSTPAIVGEVIFLEGVFSETTTENSPIESQPPGR
ncbi:MAG: DUF928 domain-containing protein [Synechococcales bacterium]|nr:DUF928 domain-containing protein [Synechococcales bacterium]